MVCKHLFLLVYFHYLMVHLLKNIENQQEW